MQHQDIDGNRIPFMARVLISRLLRMHIITALAWALFLGCASAAYADPATPAGACTAAPIDCSTATGPALDHCMTSTSSGADKSCQTHSSTPCTGNYFVATGASESNNDYTRDNQQGCLGQWQFCAPSDATRFCPSIAAFHQNANYCQDQDIIAYTQAHAAGLQQYVGKPGPPGLGISSLTLTGLLGVAHLCGDGGVIIWMQTGICPPGGGDAGGTGGTQYYKNFSETTLPAQFGKSDAVGGVANASCPGAATTGLGGAGATGTAAPAAGGDTVGSAGAGGGMGGMPMMMPMSMPPSSPEPPATPSNATNSNTTPTTTKPASSTTTNKAPPDTANYQVACNDGGIPPTDPRCTGTQ
jgi:hypothetical protein